MLHTLIPCAEDVQLEQKQTNKEHSAFATQIMLDSSPTKLVASTAQLTPRQPQMTRSVCAMLDGKSKETSAYLLAKITHPQILMEFVFATRATIWNMRNVRNSLFALLNLNGIKPSLLVNARITMSLLSMGNASHAQRMKAGTVLSAFVRLVSSGLMENV